MTILNRVNLGAALREIAERDYGCVKSAADAINCDKRDLYRAIKGDQRKHDQASNESVTQPARRLRQLGYEVHFTIEKRDAK